MLFVMESKALGREVCWDRRSRTAGTVEAVVNGGGTVVFKEEDSVGFIVSRGRCL